MSATNKSFVIKNGFEVSTDLIIANATTRKVGIGTTVPQYLLHVNGGIGATDAYVSGIATVINQLRVGTGGTVFTVLGLGNSIGVGTALPAFLLDVRSPVSTGQTALYVYGDVRITGDLVVQDDLALDEVTVRNITVSNQATTLNLSATGVGTITTLNSTSGTITNLTSTNLTGTSGTITTLGSTNGTITNLVSTSGTITTFNSTSGTITNLNVTGISTLGTVKVSSGIITATSGIVTYFGDGNFLNLTSNPSRGIGIGTTGGVVGYAVTFINFKGSGVSTAQYNSSTGIATIFFEGGGGGGGSISISTTAPVSPGSGDLWYSPDYGRTFIYYDESVVGYGTDAFWVDAAPFNVGIITSLTNVSFSPGSAISPSMFFIGDNQTGFFSPGTGQFTVVSSGSSVLNVNASGIRVTGVTTITNASGTVTIGIGTTALLVEGNARVTGILTVGSSSITLNGSTNVINVGTGLTLSSSGIVAGVITATSFVGNGSGLTGVANTANIRSDTITVGVLTATSINVPPVPITFSPSIGATGVSLSSNIIITFDQQVYKGTGNITLRENSAGGTAFSTIGVSSSSVTISGGAVTIDPPSNIGIGVTTFVVVDAGAFSGLTTTSVNNIINTYSFTTIPLTLSSINPGTGTTNIGFSTNITLTFNTPPPRGTGTITLRSGSVGAGGSTIETFNVSTSSSITVSGNDFIINPTSNLGVGLTIFAIIPSTAIGVGGSTSLGGFAGLNTTGADSYSFTTLNFTLSSINPANGATNIGVGTDITLTFTGSAPVRGTGTITLRSGSTSGSVIETFNVSTSSSITVSGNDFIINPTSNLGFSTSIHTIIPSTAIQNYVGLNTTGADTHSFTTADVALGDSYEGGFLICKASPLRWVVSPRSAEVSRTWYLREDANTRSQQVSGCTGWFVPTISQLQNPGYCCRSFWGPSPCYSSTSYWSSTEGNPTNASFVHFYNGNATYASKPYTLCVRAFRCVTY